MTQAERLGASFQRLLRENFRSGFDPASIIDRKKFYRAFRSVAGPEAFEPDEAELRAEATRSCLAWDGKFYAIDLDARPFLAEAIASAVKSGTNLVNVDVFFQKFGPELLKLGLVSPSLFKEFLRIMLGSQKLPNYLRLNPKEDLASEFTSKLADLDYLPQKKLGELFPFLTAEDTARWARKYLHFASLRNGDLYLPSAIKFEESEWQGELEKIKREVASQGYFFLSQLELSKTRANYSGLPEPVFLAALERKLREVGFKKSGPAIVSIANPKSLFQLVKNYCGKLENFTFETLKLEFGSDINKLRYLIDAINSVAFQIDSDHFVSLESIDLDEKAVDQILLDSNKAGFFPIASYPYFHLLPSISPYSWNPYVLQSYIVHRSRRFRIIRPSPNNFCIGLAYDRDKLKNPDYYQLVAQAALADNLEPDSVGLGVYLKQKGFVGQTKGSAINSVIKYMSELA